jgi:hypothetical protein
MLGGSRGRQEADGLPAVWRDRLLDDALTFRLSGRSAADEQGAPQRRLRHVEMRSWGHAVAGQDGGDLR